MCENKEQFHQLSDNYANLLINEKIPIRNELNLEQHKKICILQKKERNKKKTAEKQIENERFLTENSQRINKNYR